jgi:hypothetical protein
LVGLHELWLTTCGVWLFCFPASILKALGFDLALLLAGTVVTHISLIFHTQLCVVKALT